MFQKSLKGVSTKIEEYFKLVLRGCQGYLTEVYKMCPGSLKSVSIKFQECFKEVERVL